MSKSLSTLYSWPRRSDSSPSFHTSNDAILYAQLIYNREDRQNALLVYRQQAYKTLKKLRESTEPDLDLMFELAVRAQFYRECLEECQRIKDEKFNTPGV